MIANLSAVAAPQGGRDGAGVLDAFDQHIDAVAAPEQFAVEHHGRHAEHAERFGFIDDAVVLFSCGSCDKSLEVARGAAKGGDHAGNCVEIVEFEIMAPETAKD